MKKIGSLLQNNKQRDKILDSHKYVTKEYQDYGYRLALKLDDLSHKALYIKLAKEKQRYLLERAFSFAIDYPNAKNKGRIFMWKLKELENDAEKKKESNNEAEKKKESKNEIEEKKD